MIQSVVAPPGTPVGRAQSKFPVSLVALLAVALLINYVDRGILSTAAPQIERELVLTPSQLGWVLSAFFWTYVSCQPLMGWFADHFGPARVLAAGFVLWSVSTSLTGLAAGIAGLVTIRLLMGVGESVAYPSALALLAQRVTDRHRTRATAVMQLGALTGPAAGTFIGGLVMVRYGWRAMFMGLGLVALLWLIPWSRQVRADRVVVGAADTPGVVPPSFADIFRQRAMWGGMLGTFCANYSIYIIFTWMPLYLVHEGGLSLLSMTHLMSEFYLTDAAGALATGWLLYAWMLRGATPNMAYKTALGLSAGGVGVCLLVWSAAGPSSAAVLLLTAGFMDGLASASIASVTQHFAGPLASGRWIGVQNSIGNVGSMVAPVVTGYVVQSTGHYTAALWSGGAVALLGLVGWLVVVPEVLPVNWGSRTKAVPAADPA